MSDLDSNHQSRMGEVELVPKLSLYFCILVSLIQEGTRHGINGRKRRWKKKRRGGGPGKGGGGGREGAGEKKEEGKVDPAAANLFALRTKLQQKLREDIPRSSFINHMTHSKISY